MLHAGEVRLYDEIDRSWGDDMNGLHLLCWTVGRRGITDSVGGGVIAGANEAHSPIRENQMFVVLALRISRRV